MERYTQLRDIKVPDKKTTLSIGTFDGMHLGHKYLISRLVKKSLDNNSKSVLITFNPNPHIVINNKKNYEYHIISRHEKYNILDKLGLDVLFEINFNSDLSKVSAELFLEKYIINPFNPSNIVIGYDHRFGHKRKGDSNFLYKNQDRYGYKLEIIDPLKKDNRTISSSLIRDLLKDNKVSVVNRLLDRNYKIRGKVVKGDRIGRDINFPTANLSIESIEQIIPSNGVYFVNTIIEEKKYFGMCNIGYRPTVSLNLNKSIEVHLFNYKEFNLYSQFIDIEFVDYIRSEIKFNNKAELEAQLTKDKEYCKSLIL